MMYSTQNQSGQGQARGHMMNLPGEESGAIVRAMQDNEKLIVMLMEELDVFKMRLDPLMRPEPPALATTNAPSAQPLPTSQLAETLAAHNVRLQLAVDRLRDLRMRVDL